MIEDLYVYTPEIGNDLLLAKLWAQMNADGDLHRLFEPHGISLSGFFDRLGPPNDVSYAFDREGIWLLAWFEPMAHGALFVGYIRPDKRKSELSKSCIRNVLTRGTQQFGTLMGLTRHDHVVQFCSVVGFARAGTVPSLISGYDAHLLVATAASVQASKTANEELVQIHAWA